MRKIVCTIFFIALLILHGYTVSADDFVEDDEGYVEALHNELLQTVAKPSKEPIINSRAAVVIDRESKRILYGKNQDERRAMASTTKIMTCIIALENSKLDEIITVSKEAASVGGSRLGLSTGDKITMLDLLYGLMLCSGNDAAAQIAQTIGGDYAGFSGLMNNKAKELELTNTHFVTPHGLDNDEHYTTAYELALLTDYALKNKKFAQIVNTKNKSILINGYQKQLRNTNELLGVMDGVNGVKTGFTGMAGRCLVISCVRNNENLISVVLGADTKKNRTRDSMQILEYSFESFSQMNLKEKVENLFKEWQKDNYIEIVKGKEKYVSPQLENMIFEKFPVKGGEEEDIHIQIECDKQIESPVFDGAQVGIAKVLLGKEKIMELNLVIPYTIYKKEPIDYWHKLWKELKLCFT